MGRLDAYAANPRPDLVVAYQDGKPVGQKVGLPLTAHSWWCEGLVSEPSPVSPTDLRAQRDHGRP
jgi:hypothetical protein